jgi:O-acetylhomoserine (thiol)-lyase
VPIYQTVAYAFDSAEHGAALFNLDVEGYRYSRISNPTTAVLERRDAALEGGAEALAVATGQAALHYAVLNLAGLGSNIVSVPQLYGTTYTLFAHLLPSLGVKVRFAESDDPAAIDKLIDHDTKAVFCKSVGNPAGNICDLAALTQVAHGKGLPLIVDDTVATPILLRPFDYGADIIAHSLTKFMGGHGTTLGGIIDNGEFPWHQHARGFPMFNEPDISITVSCTGSISVEPLTLPDAAPSIKGRPALYYRRSEHFCCFRESRPLRFGSIVTSRTRERSPSSCARIRGWPGSSASDFLITLTMLGHRNI